MPAGVMQEWHLAEWSSLATIIGAPLALLALVVGVSTLRSGARAARLQHMHDLFKEYLRLQFEYHKARADAGRPISELRADLGSFKMYTLEEMQLWLSHEKGWNWHWFWLPSRRRHVASWQATIDWHLDHSSDHDFAQLWVARKCYGPAFLDLVRRSEERRAARIAAERAAAAATTPVAAAASARPA